MEGGRTRMKVQPGLLQPVPVMVTIRTACEDTPCSGTTSGQTLYQSSHLYFCDDSIQTRSLPTFLKKRELYCLQFTQTTIHYQQLSIIIHLYLRWHQQLPGAPPRSLTILLDISERVLKTILLPNIRFFNSTFQLKSIFF